MTLESYPIRLSSGRSMVVDVVRGEMPQFVFSLFDGVSATEVGEFVSPFGAVSIVGADYSEAHARSVFSLFIEATGRYGVLVVDHADFSWREVDISEIRNPSSAAIDADGVPLLLTSPSPFGNVPGELYAVEGDGLRQIATLPTFGSRTSGSEVPRLQADAQRRVYYHTVRDGQTTLWSVRAAEGPREVGTVGDRLNYVYVPYEAPYFCGRTYPISYAPGATSYRDRFYTIRWSDFQPAVVEVEVSNDFATAEFSCL